MSCTHPMKVWFKPDGKISFSPKGTVKDRDPIQLPCGQCVSCMLTRQKESALRCLLESLCYDHNAFVTLTYDDEHLGDNKLRYRDIQLFLKSLRQNSVNKIKYFVTGEYGTKKGRAHWHMLLFNVDKDTKKATIEKFWPHGHVDYQPEITFQSASYCAGYASKKLAQGKDKFLHRRSQGLGSSWIKLTKKNASL